MSRGPLEGSTMMFRITKTVVLLLAWLCAFEGRGKYISGREIEGYEEYTPESQDYVQDTFLPSPKEHGLENEDFYIGGVQRLRLLRSRSRSRMSRRTSKSKSKGRSYLDSSIEPIPFVNCIPRPASKSKSSKSSFKVGKGTKGRRRSRRHRRTSDSQADSRRLRSTSRSRGRDRGRGKGGGKGGRSDGRSDSGGRDRLPWCPEETETPTFLPTVTPLPTITPFPTQTPLPTDMQGTPSLPPSSAPSMSSAPSASFAPSISARPSSAPSISAMPSAAQAPTRAPTPVPTRAPTPVPTSPSAGGTTVRTVAARLGYGFFEGTTVREPTAEEIDGLIVQTEAFYTEVLSAAYPDRFVSFQATNIEDIFSNAESNLPVVVDFDSLVTLTSDENTPTSNEIFNAMDVEMETLQDYIQFFVWDSEPMGTSLFFDTQRVAFGARGEDF
jgi:hypothetical protein